MWKKNSLKRHRTDQLDLDSDCELVGNGSGAPAAVRARWAARPVQSVASRDFLSECPVDGVLTLPAERQAGKFYLFTQVEEDGPRRPGRKTPAEVGREGLWSAIVTAYKTAFPPNHPCHGGPLFGIIAQEGHPNSTEFRLRRLHNHGACAFPAEHKRRAVERHLREVQGVKVCDHMWKYCIIRAVT